MKSKTYDEWRELGYQVRKGERATGSDPKTGKATFTRGQVDEREEYDDMDDEPFIDHPGNPADYGSN